MRYRAPGRCRSRALDDIGAVADRSEWLATSAAWVRSGRDVPRQPYTRQVAADQGSGFLVEQTSDGATLVVTGPWGREAARVLESGGVDGLDLNYAKGFKDTDLAFIRDWPLKRLTILARTIRDLAPIYSLEKTLESLSVQVAPQADIDLGKLPLVSTLAADWVQVSPSIGDLPGLTDLYLGSYSEVDLQPLRWNPRLVSLRLKDRPRLRSLDGIDALQSLEHLGVYLAPLLDISALRDLSATQLRELHLESCRMPDLTPVAHLQSLRLLNASDCGEIESLHPLERLGDLELLWLYGTTKVADDDLSPIADLPRLRELRMKPRKSYRPSLEQVQTRIARRPQG